MLFAQDSAKRTKIQDGLPGFERACTLAAPEDWSPVPGASGDAALGAEILARVFAGQDPDHTPEIKLLAEKCLKRLPAWDDRTADPGALFFKTLALFRLGGDSWKKWNTRIESAVAESQLRPEEGIGYWESKSPRGRILGRTETTALMTLSLEVYYRYQKVVGLR